ncbi:MAG: T9SS type A sorting domain-containing protein [Bacteroidetes bacterium]|nr:T9SS type A sorting domain-containing protein [Bacteroidota bacterium]
MPFDNYLQISIVTELSDNLITHLYTSSGKLIRSFEIPVISGENTYTLNTKDLPSGMYLIKLSGNYVNESMKVVKQ